MTDVYGMDPAYPDSLTHAKVFEIKKLGAKGHERWIPEMFPDDIKWILAQVVAEIDFKMQEILLAEGMVGLDQIDFTIMVQGSRRAISAESGLQDGDAVRSDVHHFVTHDITNNRTWVD